MEKTSSGTHVTKSSSGAVPTKLNQEQASQLVNYLRNAKITSQSQEGENLTIKTVNTGTVAPDGSQRKMLAIPIELLKSKVNQSPNVCLMQDRHDMTKSVTTTSIASTPPVVSLPSGPAMMQPIQIMKPFVIPSVSINTDNKVTNNVMRNDVKRIVFPDDQDDRRTDKNIGLRQFAMRVCQKVQQKGSTTYREVADELIAEAKSQAMTEQLKGSAKLESKNIRRRVYDALNVLMAMNIVTKQDKEIQWLGFPFNTTQEVEDLQREQAERMQRIQEKKRRLQELILQQVAFKNLIRRNREREQSSKENDGGELRQPPTAVQLPFIVVNTSKDTVVNCSISDDKREYLFNFDDTFEIHDGMQILKQMNLTCGLETGNVAPDDLALIKLSLPAFLHPYVDDMAANGIGSADIIDVKPLQPSTGPASLDSGDQTVLPNRPEADLGGRKRKISPCGASDESDHEATVKHQDSSFVSAAVNIDGPNLAAGSSVFGQKFADDDDDEEEEEEEEDVSGESGNDCQSENDDDEELCIDDM